MGNDVPVEHTVEHKEYKEQKEKKEEKDKKEKKKDKKEKKKDKKEKKDKKNKQDKKEKKVKKDQMNPVRCEDIPYNYSVVFQIPHHSLQDSKLAVVVEFVVRTPATERSAGWCVVPLNNLLVQSHKKDIGAALL